MRVIFYDILPKQSLWEPDILHFWRLQEGCISGKWWRWRLNGSWWFTPNYSSPPVFSDPAVPMSISLSNGHALTLQFLYCISFEYFGITLLEGVCIRLTWHLHNHNMTHVSWLWRCHVMIMKVSCHDYEGVMSWLWRCHVMIMKVSCHDYEGVMSWLWRCHVMIMKVSCHDYEGVMLWLWRCHVMIMKVSYYDYEGVMSWLWRCHVMIMKVSCHDYEGVMSVLCTPLQVKCNQYFSWGFNHFWLFSLS